MNKFIRLSLLMMLMPLFVLNVSAMELPNETNIEEIVAVEEGENQEIENNTSKIGIEEIMEMIPTEMDIDCKEEDFFKNNEEGNLVELAIQNKISKILMENEINLEEISLTYEIKNKIGDHSIYLFDLIFEEDKVVTIQVNYRNTGWIEEDYQRILEEIFGENRSLSIIKYYDFYTRELIGEDYTLEEYLNSIIPEEYKDIIKYYYILEEDVEKDFSREIKGNLYLLIDGVLYDCFSIKEEYQTKIQITEDLEEDYVLQEVEEYFQENSEESFPENDFEFLEENEVHSKSQDTNFGRIEIEKLEEKRIYSILEGANSILDRTNLSYILRVEGMKQKFIALFINNVEVNKKYYELTDSLKIVLKEEFLKSLIGKEYDVVVKFSDGEANTTFTLKEEERVEQVQPSPTPNPTYQENNTTSNYYTNTVENTEVEEQEKQEDTELEESKEVSKDKEESPKKEIVVKEQEEDPKKWNVIPVVIIVIAAIIVGTFGFVVYKRSQEED